MNDPDPVMLVGANDVGAALELDKNSALRLMESRIAGRLYVAGNRRMVAQEELDRLHRPFVAAPHPSAFVVRVGSAHPERIEPHLRSHEGWRADLSPEARLRGVRWPWRIVNPGTLTGRLFVAVLATYVVEVAVITGYRNRVGGLRELLLRPSEEGEGAEAFVGRRLRSPAGGNTYYLDSGD